MLNYELWFILLDISNKEKINLIDEYESEENIYNNFENILKENKKLQKNLEILKRMIWFIKLYL